MAYAVEFTPNAQRQFEKLDGQIKRRIAPLVDALADNPRPPGTTKLTGHGHRYRQRVGDYRIVYDVRDDLRLVSIALIRHRRDVYRV